MHALHSRDFADAAATGWPLRSSSPPVQGAPEPLSEPSRYGARRTSPAAIVGVAAAHAAVLALLVTLDVIPVHRPAPKPLVVELLREVPPPPPEPVAAVAPEKPVERLAVAPPPVVRVETPPPPVIAAPPPPVVLDAPPVSASAVIAAPVAAGGDGVVDRPDVPPQTLARAELRYPVESRRKKEEGTVVIAVLITTDGDVSEIKVRASSGFDRLDDAALSSVRRWRFRAAQKDGRPVMAWGVVSIPFQLKA